MVKLARDKIKDIIDGKGKSLIDKMRDEINDCYENNLHSRYGKTRDVEYVRYCTYFCVSNQHEPMDCRMRGVVKYVKKGKGITETYVPYYQCGSNKSSDRTDNIDYLDDILNKKKKK